MKFPGTYEVPWYIHLILHLTPYIAIFSQALTTGKDYFFGAEAMRAVFHSCMGAKRVEGLDEAAEKGPKWIDDCLFREAIRDFELNGEDGGEKGSRTITNVVDEVSGVHDADGKYHVGLSDLGDNKGEKVFWCREESRNVADSDGSRSRVVKKGMKKKIVPAAFD